MTDDGVQMAEYRCQVLSFGSFRYRYRLSLIQFSVLTFPFPHPPC